MDHLNIRDIDVMNGVNKYSRSLPQQAEVQSQAAQVMRSEKLLLRWVSFH